MTQTACHPPFKEWGGAGRGGEGEAYGEICACVVQGSSCRPGHLSELQIPAAFAPAPTADPSVQQTSNKPFQTDDSLTCPVMFC